MKKKLHNILAVVLIIVVMLNLSALAVYIPPDSPDASAYISSYSASVINGGNGKLKVQFWVTGTGTMTSIGATCIKIYKSNGTYVTEVWHTYSGRSGMMGSNKIYHSDTETFYVSPGSYYAKVTVYAQNASGSDDIVVTTGTKTIT